MNNLTNNSAINEAAINEAAIKEVLAGLELRPNVYYAKIDDANDRVMVSCKTFEEAIAVHFILNDNIILFEDASCSDYCDDDDFSRFAYADIKI